MVVPDYALIYIWNIPTISVKFISPQEILQRHSKSYRIHTTHSAILEGNWYLNIQVHTERDKTVIKILHEYYLEHN